LANWLAVLFFFLVRDFYGSTEEDLNILLYDLEQVSCKYPYEAADTFCFYGRALLALCGEEGEGKEEEEGEDEEGDILLGIAWRWLAVAKLLYTKQKQVVSPEEGKILEGKVCETLLTMADVCLMIESYEKAVVFITKCINISRESSEIAELEALVLEIKEKIEDEE